LYRSKHGLLRTASAFRAIPRISAAMLLFAAPAHALPAFWDLDVSFTDGGTATGSFAIDTPAKTPTDWSLAISGGNEASFPPIVLDPTNSQASTFDVAGLERRINFQVNDSDRTLRITPEELLAGAACEVALDFTANSGNTECFNCSPFRSIAAGSLSRPCLVGTTVQAGFSVDNGSGLSGSSVPIVVEPGEGDLTQIGGSQAFPNTIDVEASSFTIAIASTGFSDAPFNGVVVSDLDWFDRPDLTVAEVFFETNIPGFTSDRVTFGPREVLVNFSALSVNGGIVTVALQAPEPAGFLTGAAALVSLLGLTRLRSGRRRGGAGRG
jgi:hypothetical protein